MNREKIGSDVAIGTFADAVGVFPTVVIKGVWQKGVTQNEAHLAFGHTNFELVNHLFGDDVTLLDVDFVHPGEAKVRATRQAYGE